MRLSFDMDGCLCDGSYVPKEARTPEFYAGVGVAHSLVIPTLNALAKKHTVYIISSRRFPSATRITQKWLWMQGCLVEDLAGVLCGVGIYDKLNLGDILDVQYHIDDDPTVIFGQYSDEGRRYSIEPILLHNPSRGEYKGNIPVIPDWPHLVEYFCHLGLL